MSKQDEHQLIEDCLTRVRDVLVARKSGSIDNDFAYDMIDHIMLDTKIQLNKGGESDGSRWREYKKIVGRK